MKARKKKEIGNITIRALTSIYADKAVVRELYKTDCRYFYRVRVNNWRRHHGLKTIPYKKICRWIDSH